MRACVGLVEPPVAHQPIDLDVLRHIHHDDALQPLARILGEQRDVHDDHMVGLHLCLHPAGHLRANRRVHDAIEVLQGLRVGEDDRGDHGAVQRAVGCDDLRAEALGHPRQHRRAGLLQVADDGVRVHDHRAPLGEQRADGGLAGTDTTGEADEDHRATVAGTLRWC